MSASSVPLRRLGKDGPNVPALGYGPGTMAMPAYGATLPEDEQFKALDHALGLGNTFWDIAE